ncbi:DUF547 domain-containing protein [Tenacibaculum singaporense]|uniref:DUF547 domain-containing protein n=1 Tax=Tenacibaculum singaporense TaxID=2358479 RepID=A0A3Q8RQG4_9FLAO|nr:DUF547 domain-containing protein [Tenacibaculum singaporense]AZJ34681.1 DUF547 domain-containing protein [Tenacibaculum singaporense]
MRNIFLLLSLAFFLHTSAQTNTFDALLKKHVNTKGSVNYKGFKQDETQLKAYLNKLAVTKPQKSWSAAKAKAFWANAYNAYTIQLILDNYPLKSIMNIKKKGKDAWSIPFAKVGGKTYTLNQIEHEILRKKYSDPKIHVAVNCASGSCPQLANYTFTEKNYESKTTLLMKKFINDSSRNKISENKVQLSKIFEWFQEDFTKEGDLINFLNQYSNVKINQKAKISYLKYDWSLNGR